MKIIAIGVEITPADVKSACEGESQLINTLLSNETVASFAEFAKEFIKKKNGMMEDSTEDTEEVNLEEEFKPQNFEDPQ